LFVLLYLHHRQTTARKQFEVSKRKKITTLEKIQATEGKFLRSIDDVKPFLQIYPYLSKLTFHLNRPELSEYIACLRGRRIGRATVKDPCSGWPFIQHSTVSMDFEFHGDGLINAWAQKRYVSGAPDKQFQLRDQQAVLQFLIECGYCSATDAAEALRSK
jgi:hypothetical protein